MSISITQAAKSEMENIKASQDLGSETFLRIGILGGGCSGLRYALNFDDHFDSALDTKYDVDGVMLAMQRKFEPHFDGATIDYVETPEARGFMVENPNFPKSAGCSMCGCGC